MNKLLVGCCLIAATASLAAKPITDPNIGISAEVPETAQIAHLSPPSGEMVVANFSVSETEDVVFSATRSKGGGFQGSSSDIFNGMVRGMTKATGSAPVTSPHAVTFGDAQFFVVSYNNFGPSPQHSVTHIVRLDEARPCQRVVGIQLLTPNGTIPTDTQILAVITSLHLKTDWAPASTSRQ